MRDCGNKIAHVAASKGNCTHDRIVEETAMFSTAIYQDTQPTGIPRTPRYDRNQGRRHWRAICGVCSRSVKMQIPAFRSDFLRYTPALLIRQSVLFFGTAVWRVLIISALLLLPCFWHKRIEAGDLPSHTY